MTGDATARVEDIEWLINTGETHCEAIAKRVGVKPASLDRILRRAGRADLTYKITARPHAKDAA